jgi:hypothetical protein
MVGRLVAQMDDVWADRDLIHRQGPRPPPPQPNLRAAQQPQQDNVPENEDANVGLLEEDQVLLEILNEHLDENASASTLRPPVDLLWGLGPNRQISERESGGSNVIAAEEETAVAEVDQTMGIPLTWLNTGFHLSTCGTGLIVKAPPKDELAFFTWRQQQNARGQLRNNCPPPYHCRAITGILSLVTALLYSGASIQGKQVSCSSVRTPFAELSESERKRQFESRLADALSALLLIAANASLDRKKRALAKRRETINESGALKRLERKLFLCPTCWWEKNPSTGEPRIPEGRDASQRVQLSVSLTHIQDLRTYVLSNLRSFMSRGGCALFLETILRIHGRNVIKQLLAKARRQPGNVATATALISTESLISCTCEERQKAFLQKPKASSSRTPGGGRDDPNKMIDATPPGHECLSVELLSLLLTGEVHSTLHGWSADNLGIGILSNRKDQVGWHLRYPEQRIWLLRGPTCYSVLRQKDENKEIDASRQKLQTQRVDDSPGQVLELSHWNCWYVERNHSELRLMTARGTWTPPSFKTGSTTVATSVNADTKENTTVAGISERRDHQRARVVHADDDNVPQSQQPDSDFDDDEISDERLLDLIRIHPDDFKYYPKNFMLCRFDMGESPSDDAENRKPRGEHWTPFHRLSRRQRRMVRTKLGPQITPLLETRWPRVTFLQFATTPSTNKDGPLYPVV